MTYLEEIMVKAEAVMKESRFARFVADGEPDHEYMIGADGVLYGRYCRSDATVTWKPLRPVAEDEICAKRAAFEAFEALPEPPKPVVYDERDDCDPDDCE